MIYYITREIMLEQHAHIEQPQAQNKQYHAGGQENWSINNAANPEISTRFPSTDLALHFLR
jgi:hypothetical protein